MGAYRFLTTWRLEAPADRVWEALQDAEAYPRWWPGVEQVEVLRAGAADGTGRRARVTMRGRLPYRLRFEIVAREVRELERIVVDATGSLQGSGRWELRHDAGVTTMTYSWEVATMKAWMNVIEIFARPALIANLRRCGTGSPGRMAPGITDGRTWLHWMAGERVGALLRARGPVPLDAAARTGGW